MVRLPIICPKGKATFMVLSEFLSCNCKFPSKKCTELKAASDIYMTELTGGIGYVDMGYSSQSFCVFTDALCQADDLCSQKRRL